MAYGMTLAINLVRVSNIRSRNKAAFVRSQSTRAGGKVLDLTHFQRGGIERNSGEGVFHVARKLDIAGRKNEID